MYTKKELLKAFPKVARNTQIPWCSHCSPENNCLPACKNTGKEEWIPAFYKWRMQNLPEMHKKSALQGQFPKMEVLTGRNAHNICLMSLENFAAGYLLRFARCKSESWIIMIYRYFQQKTISILKREKEGK